MIIGLSMVIGLMEESEAQWIVDLLVSNVSLSESPAEQIPYAKALVQLIQATGDRHEVARILTIITNQAHQLGQAIDWLEAELLFETKARTSQSRQQLLLDEVEAEGGGNDYSLDLYTIRLHRFALTK
ncbi:hypothetical protein M0L20_25225 [Spirosoma sp. RP8]|uniref:Uncharacterized protein n=1 Tax=Spirosoma liriopis TaxID=2937440 RepID=A0ABT0HSN6_9BACT|nr:hypothetical protein [Spirosoma liriopis]MCK8495198.1 hypothetical protein [Spirosoma liriopis]